MELAMMDLGKMGGNMVSRLLRGGHRVVAQNRSPEPVLVAMRYQFGGHVVRRAE